MWYVETRPISMGKKKKSWPCGALYTEWRSLAYPWAIKNRPQKQRKSCFCVRSLYARWSHSHFSFGVDKFGVHWKIVERLLRDRWAFLERSLRDRFPWWSLRDCVGQSQNVAETVAITGRSLRDLGDRRRSLKDRWEIWPFVHRSTISQRSPPLCKGGFFSPIHSVLNIRRP